MSEKNSGKNKDKWPAGEPPPSEEELQLAEELGAQVDALLGGEAAKDSGEELAVAAMVRAATRDTALEPSRRDQLIDEALRLGAGAKTAPEQVGRGRIRRWAPALALAASLLVGLAVVLQLSPRREVRRPLVPLQLTSRASDALLGRPIEDRAGASARLDLVFADRMGGYRRVRLGARGTL